MSDADEPREQRCRNCHGRDAAYRRGHPAGPLCARCRTDLRNRDDNERALAEGATAPGPPLPPRCPDCGVIQDRYETGYRRWVLFEYGITLPVGTVPVGERWIVGADGLAVNIGDGVVEPHTAGHVRHALACPCGDTRAALTAAVFTALRALRDEESGLRQ